MMDAGDRIQALVEKYYPTYTAEILDRALDDLSGFERRCIDAFREQARWSPEKLRELTDALFQFRATERDVAAAHQNFERLALDGPGAWLLFVTHDRSSSPDAGSPALRQAADTFAGHATRYINLIIDPLLGDLQALNDALTSEFTTQPGMDSAEEHLERFLFELGKIHQTRLFLERRKAAVRASPLNAF